MKIEERVVQIERVIVISAEDMQEDNLRQRVENFIIKIRLPAVSHVRAPAAAAKELLNSVSGFPVVYHADDEPVHVCPKA